MRLIAPFALALPILAQMAEISGTIRDSSNAIVPGAAVTAIQLDTNARRSAVGSAEGIYVLPALVPGAYTMEVGAAGFQTTRETGVVAMAANCHGWHYR